MTDWPRITLVTPSFNQGDFIEATLDSVLSQNYPALEYFVIDGGSRDRTRSILERYSAHLSAWVSEADQGQSHAIEKGMARATGEIVNWLNSDDLLQPGALHRIAAEWRQARADLYVGRDIQFVDEPERPCGEFRPAGYSHPECLRFWDGGFRYHQPPTFMAREAYFAAGGVNRRWHYAMDYDLYCRILRRDGCRVRYIDCVLTAFRLHEASKTQSRKAEFLREMAEISMSLWPQEWNRSRESRDMQGYTAACLLIQAKEALMSGSVARFAQLTTKALAASPRAAIVEGWRRLTGSARS